MRSLVVLPVLIALGTAILATFAWRSVKLQRGIVVAGAAAHLFASLLLLREVNREGVMVLQMGSWAAPFGITFAVDLLGAIMVTLTGFIGLMVVLYSLSSIDPERERHGYYPLIQTLIMGVSGAFLTGDLFNLYVWFEVMLISSFVLLALGGEKPQLEGAFKYVILNLLSSTFFVCAVGIIYGVHGSLNMAELSVKMSQGSPSGLTLATGLMLMVSFGIKAAVFPLYSWLPASYHTPPTAITALLAGLLTKVGVYALIRVFTLMYSQHSEVFQQLLLWIACLTMISGVLGAAAHRDIKRILSFHIVSQVGYMVLGLGLFSHLALAGSVFYLMHHIIVKTNLFFVTGIIEKAWGTAHLDGLGSIWKRYPGLGFVFMVSAFSLAGIPPLSGFFAKFILVKAGVESRDWWIIAVALLVSLLTAFSMTKIWNEAFWKEAPEGARKEGKPDVRLLLPAAFMAIVTIGIGLGAGRLFDLSMRAATQLMDPSIYTRAVLGPASAPAPGVRP